MPQDAAKERLLEAMDLVDEGDLEGAAAAAAAAAAEALKGPADPEARMTAAVAEATRAQALTFLGRPEEAAPPLDRALEALEALIELPEVARSARNLLADTLAQRAQLHDDLDEVEPARALFARGVAALETSASETDPEAILTYARVALQRAEFLAEQDGAIDVAASEAAARRAIELCADDPLLRAEAYDLWADVLDARDAAREASEVREQGLDVLLTATDREGFDLQELLSTASEVADGWYEQEEAERAQAAIARVEAALNALDALPPGHRAALQTELDRILGRPTGLWADPAVAPQLHRHAAAALEKQLHLSDVVGERDWRVDLAGDGVLRFGDDLGFKIQILGSESEVAGTWLWAWANERAGFPPALVEAARELKALGEREGIDVLTTPELSLDQVDGHTLSMLAVGLLDGDAYYRGPYDGGAGFFLIRDPSFPQPETPLQRLLTVFPQLLQMTTVGNHRAAWLGYMEHHGFAVQEEAERVVATTPSGSVTASFDEQDRLTQLSAEIGGEG